VRGEKSVGVSCVLCVFLHFVFQSSRRGERRALVCSCVCCLRESSFINERARTHLSGRWKRAEKWNFESSCFACHSPSFAFLSTSAYFFLIKNQLSSHRERRSALHNTHNTHLLNARKRHKHHAKLNATKQRLEERSHLIQRVSRGPPRD